MLFYSRKFQVHFQPIKLRTSFMFVPTWTQSWLHLKCNPPTKHSRFNENSFLNFHNNRLAEKCVVSFIHIYLRRGDATRNFFFLPKHWANKKERKISEMLFSINRDCCLEMAFFSGWRWFFKILIKFILHVCTQPHIMAVVFHIFGFGAHEEKRKRKKILFLVFLIKNEENSCSWKIIKNNYRREK